MSIIHPIGFIEVSVIFLVEIDPVFFPLLVDPMDEEPDNRVK
jgi:hypothetical protein